MERLIRGYREFRKFRWPRERSRYLDLSRKGQKPEYLIIACSDSRSDPATIFDAQPGEFFVVRVIAAIVPPYEEKTGYFGTRSAIAYAVMALNVRNIVVMGHAQCGGVAAAMNPDAAGGIPYVKEWVSLLNPVVEGATCEPKGLDPCGNVERETVKLSVSRLLEYPFIAERVRAGTLRVDGARFGIADGVLEVLDRKTGNFEPVRRRSWVSW